MIKLGIIFLLTALFFTMVYERKRNGFFRMLIVLKLLMIFLFFYTELGSTERILVVIVFLISFLLPYILIWIKRYRKK